MTTVNVGTLRLTVRYGDSTVLQLRAARGLQAADLTPAGMPPAAVLVVRRLADPMPRRFGLGRLRPPPEWERSVRGALETAARAASRPDERGRIDPKAEAVLFEDDAQVLACLVMERAHGGAASSWWWRALLGRLQLPAMTITAPGHDPTSFLLARPREAPAAIAWVSRWRQTSAVAQASSRHGARACVRALGAAHGLPAEWLAASDDEGDFDIDRAATGLSAPWRAFIPQDIARTAVPREVQRLFGVALGVHAGPAQMHASVAAAIASRPLVLTRSTPPLPADHFRATGTANDSSRVVDTARDGDSPAISARSTVDRATSGAGSNPAIAQPDDRVSTADRSGARSERVLGSGDVSVESNERSIATGPPSGVAAVESGMLPQTHQQADAVSHGGPHGEQAAPTVVRSVTSQSRQSRHLAALESASAWSSVLATDGVATGLGGVFYLIHALRALQLPDAFDPRWRLDAIAGPWGTLDLIARALLGSRDESADPLWRALAALAAWPERHHQPRATPASLSPSAATNDPRFSAPAAWREELDGPGDRLAWTSVGARVWLWSPSGYLISHGHTSDGSEAAARRALRGRSGVAKTTALTRKEAGAIPWLPPAVLPAGCPSRLGRWAAAVAPAVLRRVSLALDDRGAGHRSTPGSIARAIRPVLAIPARLYVTSSHVDVVMALRDIDVRVRRAGLDRDPGWIPAFGRVVYFHFA